MKSNISEATIAGSFNSELNNMGHNFWLENEWLNESINSALEEYLSKNGKNGGNRPDCKMLLEDELGNSYPILIEYKVGFNKMVKLDSNGYPDLTQLNNVKNYAVNGAIHYARAVRLLTYYTDIIVIGAVGEKNTNGKLEREVQVWWVSDANYGKGKLIKNIMILVF
ncbi:hypothetical protein CIB43_00572 [Mesomycoplasma hyopneumoniae]|uniref:Uncharacterized protein n=1 Tax=Mesomycoplasma hyopneumoniae TaxID=2099 RepID=A0A223MAB5_MESHO|nr:hypothetical protein CIB43_00572 [Mesomycoplasma hyopneumoniae]